MDGDSDGISVGILVDGLKVGITDGDIVGIFEGAIVGNRDGCDVEGVEVGEPVVKEGADVAG